MARMGMRTFWWLGLSALIVLGDQLSKQAIVDHLALYQRQPVLPFFDLVRLHNTGAAFSFLAGAAGWQNRFFMAVAVVVSVALVWWLATLPRKGRGVLALGLALVVGGAIGNLIDRALYGYVIDFLLFYYREWSYPAFNVADSAISCGVALILFDGLVLERRRRHR
ncbi:MAG: lipoprotein signal peptidase [Gammaproteobacteria bacterium]|nr:MAG: lipoprotein signal peptidase [Gammaproteobacteria bacterium]